MRGLLFIVFLFSSGLVNASALIPAEFVIQVADLTDVAAQELAVLFDRYGLALPYDILIAPSNMMYSGVASDIERTSIQDLDDVNSLELYVESVAGLLALENEDFRDALIEWYRSGQIVQEDILYPLAYSLASETPAGDGPEY